MATEARGRKKSRIIALEAAGGKGEEWSFDTFRDLYELWNVEPPEGFRPGSWQSYVAGVFKFVGERCGTPFGEGRVPALDVVIASDVPLGGGLSSSASLEVALGKLIALSARVDVAAVEMVQLCQQAEHEFARVPCGAMDQEIAVLASEGHAVLLDCHGIGLARLVPMPSTDHTIVIMDTGVKHALGASEYSSRRSTCAAAAVKLGVRWLCDFDVRDLAAKRDILSGDEYRCARHAIMESARTLEGARALEQRDFALFGELMNASHNSLRDDFRVSCAELDTVVEAARAIPGVLGARMTGGGFGGCAIALARADVLERLCEEVTRAYRVAHGRVPMIFATRAGAGASKLMLKVEE